VPPKIGPCFRLRRGAPITMISLLRWTDSRR
jgi:hypothetical protein